jgi:hypothetical protein
MIWIWAVYLIIFIVWLKIKKPYRRFMKRKEN